MEKFMLAGKTVLKTQLSPFFFRVPCAMITVQSSVADPVCYVSFLASWTTVELDSNVSHSSYFVDLNI